MLFVVKDRIKHGSHAWMGTDGRARLIRYVIAKDSQKRLAAILDITPNEWSQYENGTRRISSNTEFKLNQKFGITQLYIRTGATNELRGVFGEKIARWEGPPPDKLKPRTGRVKNPKD